MTAIHRFLALLFAFVTVAPVFGQAIPVTFRFIAPSGSVSAAYVRGDFNGWATNDPMTRGADNQWTLQQSFSAGTTTEYKIYYEIGSTGTWITDPLNPISNPADNNNSVLTVSDPMIFQMSGRVDSDGLVTQVFAGIFSSEPLATVSFTLGGVQRTDGLSFVDGNGLFTFDLDAPTVREGLFRLEVVTASGQTVANEIGESLSGASWASSDYRTTKAEAVLRGTISRPDGTIDPGVTAADVTRDGAVVATATVNNGSASVVVPLQMGDNPLVLTAMAAGATVTSDTLHVTRWVHPLEAATVEPSVSGSDFAFSVSLVTTDQYPGGAAIEWQLDDVLSTVEVSGLEAFGLGATGTASGAGEVYLDVVITADGATIDQLRVAVRVEADGTARAFENAETASWVNGAVVYEIFPLMFGREARASSSTSRFVEITNELDYIADMGFNTIWFMPIMENVGGMTGLGGGYNIADFKNVDPKLGSKDEFRALVDRAHDLGLRVILDTTPSHVSPDHPWTTSLRNDGPLGTYLQTQPSNHNRGLDGRGANLPEIWQTGEGGNLYRKYEGFGDLANVDWDDDDLQAEMLDVMAYWINEFGVDGYRLDVYWGPWRRYGPDRFGRPLREIVRRAKPDAWLLGEIVGSGVGTEVYYADDDNGTAVVGGLDSAYDWQLYWDAVRGTYGNVSRYHNLLTNNDFWPGPNARYFRFLENHDEQRIAKLMASTPDRVKPLAGALLTSPGIPMVYQGQEVNYGAGSGDTRRTPVNWATSSNGEYGGLYQRLAQARSQFPAFWSQKQVPVYVSRAGSPPAYVFVRPYTDENALVAINFDDEPVTVTIDPFPSVLMSTDGPVPYYDLAADTSLATLEPFSITIPPYETVVYITSDAPAFDLPPMPPLPFGAVNTDSGRPSEVPDRVHLAAAYPNPFNPVTTIAFEVPASGEVSLMVFDVLGRRVSVLADGLVTAGRHEAYFDASGLPSGTYLYRLSVGSTAVTKTMVLVK